MFGLLLPWQGLAASLDKISLAQEGATTRVTLHTQNTVKYRHFGLSKPDRLVIDLSDVSSKLRG